MWNFWPFTKPEQRAGQPYHDAILNSFVRGASTKADGFGLASLETACAFYSKAFASATVTPDNPITRSLTPEVLGLIGRHLIRRGEAVFLLDVEDGAVVLDPVGSWNVVGGAREREWRYQVTLHGPSETLTKWVPSAAVVHVRYAVELSRPWQGLGPLAWSSDTARLAAILEKRLAQECDSPVGRLLPIPLGPVHKGGGGALDQLQQDIAKLSGESVLIESTTSGWGEGRGNAPRGDWDSKRIGADPPIVLKELRSDTGRAILGACAVPVELVEASASGQGSREAWRRFVYGSVSPLAKTVETELSKKLETDVELNFADLQGADLTGRASAFFKLIQSGMSPSEAATVSQLEEML